MYKPKQEILLIILIGCVGLLMLANLGLFLRMNQLQNEVLRTLQGFQGLSELPQGLPEGVKAPPFNLTDINGHVVSLQDFSGQTIMVVFSRTTCPACQRMYSILKSFHENHPEQIIVMISNGTEEENSQLPTKEGLEFPILIWQDDIAGAYQVPGTPYFYVIDGQGVILKSKFVDSLEGIEGLFRPDE